MFMKVHEQFSIGQGHDGAHGDSFDLEVILGVEGVVVATIMLLRLILEGNYFRGCFLNFQFFFFNRLKKC